MATHHDARRMPRITRLKLVKTLPQEKATANHSCSYCQDNHVMMPKDKSSHKGVNGSSIRKPSPGRDSSARQGEPDRHPVTVCNARKDIKIGTWNVRTLYQCGKLENAKKEMNRLGIDILGMSEVRWPLSGKIKTDDMTFIYSGPEKNHESGVGILLNAKTSATMKGYWTVSDRIIVVKLEAKPHNISIVQVYAPTSSSSEEDIDAFYEDLDRALKQCISQEVRIVMGDLNAKVGQGKHLDIVGPHGLGERNDRGDRWVEWCSRNNQSVTNTWFKNHPRRLWTWRNPNNSVKNQIDFITINTRFRNAVRQSKCYPGADIDSDHVLLVCTLRIKLKKLTTKKREKKIDIQCLKNNTKIRKVYCDTVKEQLTKENTKHLETKFNNLKEALIISASKVLPQSERRAKKKWMTEEILNLMEERRRSKTNETEYVRLNAIIRKKCKEEKERHLNQQCEEIEDLEKKNPQKMHNLVKELTKTNKCSTSSCIEGRDGTILMEKDEILHRWEDYINELFEDNRGEKPAIRKNEESLPILEEEVECAMRKMKTGKAVGPDGIAVEMIQALGDFGITKLTELANIIYSEGHFPQEMCKSVFITLPKKPGTTKCELHRTISLMSQITKLVLQILLKRMRGRTKGAISEEQYGFVPDKGTRNAIFVLRMLSERAIEMQRDIHVCFIDYVKAFDKVRHEQLFEVLHKLDIDGKILEILKNLYWDQKAAVRIENELSEWIDIRRGVRQGCVCSPELFSLYTESIMAHIMDMDGIKVGGININNLRYADDTALIADSEEKLQSIMDVIVRESEKLGLSINLKKSFTLVISKVSTPPVSTISIHGTALQQVNQFQYLGSIITSDGKCDSEIKRRIGIAKTTFMNMSNLLTSKNIRKETRLRLLKCYVWSTLLYGCETWTISKTMEDRLCAAEMWFLRRMWKVSWTERVTNEKVLEKAGTSRKLLKTILDRQTAFFGHVMRKNAYELLSVTGRFEGKRSRGKQRQTFMDYLSRKLNSPRIDILNAAYDRERWHSMTGNVRS